MSGGIMKLSTFDEQSVRLITTEDEIFDGLCRYCPAEYCQIELGVDEEALEIDHWVFYKSRIRSVTPFPEGESPLWQSLPQHRMRLEPEPFARIERGEKTWELRLWDEKRRRIHAGDVIRFESRADDTDTLYALVREIRVFPSFAELYRALPLTEIGYAPEEAHAASASDMDRYYSPEGQARWGAAALRLELL